MTGTVLEDPQWSLERRASSGHLVWRKDTPSSKVRFRFDVEVLEFEKDPSEDLIEETTEDFDVSNISSTLAICVTCMAAAAVSVLLPWYLMHSA